MKQGKSRSSGGRPGSGGSPPAPESPAPPKQEAATDPRPAGGGFLVVGLGASAGGLEAFTQFFTHMPGDSGLAFVLVSHLDPDHESLMTGLLRRSTSMPVEEARDGMRVMPNRVYVIPPQPLPVYGPGRPATVHPPGAPGSAPAHRRLFPLPWPKTRATVPFASSCPATVLTAPWASGRSTEPAACRWSRPPPTPSLTACPGVR